MKLVMVKPSPRFFEEVPAKVVVLELAASTARRADFRFVPDEVLERYDMIRNELIRLEDEIRKCRQPILALEPENTEERPRITFGPGELHNPEYDMTSDMVHGGR